MSHPWTLRGSKSHKDGHGRDMKQQPIMCWSILLEPSGSFTGGQWGKPRVLFPWDSLWDTVGTRIKGAPLW